MNLEEIVKKHGEAIDANAAVLKIVSTAVNIICDKLGIKTDEITKAIFNQLEKDLGGESLRPQQAGSNVGNSSQQQSTILNSAISGVIDDIHDSKGKGKARESKNGH